MTERSFPSDFLWGVAAAGHQVEGDNTNSDTWFAEQMTPPVFQEPSGKACNGYELWREDIDLARGMGLNAYRFSVEWARVEPEEGTFSDEALDHYEAIVDHCLEVGMAPVVTFNHFTSPHWFAMRGSWLDPKAPELFARYCDRVMERFGDRIAFAVTMNEPNLTRLLSWIDLPVLHPRRRARHPRGRDRGDRRAALPARQRDAARGDGRLRRRHDRGPRRREGRDQGPPRRPPGRPVARDRRRRRGRRRRVGARPQAGRGLRALARAGPRRRLRRRAELRAHRRTTATGAVPPRRRAAQPDGQRDRAALARRRGPLRPRGDRRTRPGHRARHVHR